MSGALGSALMSAFMDPGVNALAGMAQGFAQAAMPTRMPIPLGAAIGMGAGGGLQGVRQSQQMQQEQQKIALGGMQNKLLGSQLPFQLAKNKMMADLWSNPAALNSVLNGGPIGDVAGAALQVAPPQTGTGAPVAPVAQEPIGFRNANPGNLRFVGQPGAQPGEGGFAKFPDMQAGFMQGVRQLQLYGDRGINTLSGIASTWAPKGDGNNDPTAYASTLSRITGLPADQPLDLKDPSVVGKVMTGIAQIENGRALPPGVGTQAVATPAGGTPATPPAAVALGAGAPATPPASQALAIANQYEAAANKLQMRIGRAKFLGLPAPPGDPAAFRTAAQQYRALALAGPTALAQGLAKASTTPITDRFGNVYIGDGQGGFKYLGRGSEVKPVWNPKTGQMEYGDVGGIGVGAIPGEDGGGAQAVAPPPMQEHFMTERGKDLAEQFNKIDTDAASAKDSNYLFDNLRRDAQTWDMGKFADFAGDARAWLSAAGHALGVDTSGLDKKLGDYQAFRKSSGQLLRTAVHDVSSRAAVQEYNLIGETLPTPTTSAQGFGQVADQWQGVNDYRIAKQKFAAAYSSHPQDFNVDFNSQVSPTSFMLNRMAQSPQGQQDMQTMFARLSQTAEGRIAVRHMQRQYQFAKTHGLFEGLPGEQPSQQPTPGAPPQTGSAP